MLTINFKGTTNHDLDVICIDAGRRQGAEEQIETYLIPYRDDEPTVHTGKYKPYLRPMIFGVKDSSKLKDLIKWLQGYGKLITSKDIGGYFKANVISQRRVARHSKNYDYVEVIFKINPGFFYLGSGDTPLFLTVPGNIENLGTHTAKPYIKITGTGNITLTVNGLTVNFTAVDGYIELDCESQYCYKETVNQGDKMVGAFPEFITGVNTISWTGTVTEVMVLPRWREL